MSDRQAARARTEMLKRLREAHQQTVAETQTLLREQSSIRKNLRKAMAGGPKTVPQIAENCDLSADQVLWHVTAMKKYDEIVETGMDGEYYQYQLASEIKP